MKTRMIPFVLAGIFHLFLYAGCVAQDDPAAAFSIPESADTIEPLELSDRTWKDRLTDTQFHILREKGTERAYSHPYWNKKEKGVYVCAACGLTLFDSETKFKSGTGWPSFYKPIQANHIRYENDRSYGSVRVEVLCARCGGHLGHVFKDGPEPTGLRYCLNGAALDFEPTEE